MILYRLTKTKHLATAWTGYGAKQAGGRWNSVGTSMCYLSETASLTLLETLVHLHVTQMMDAFTLLRINVPDDQVLQADMAALPTEWHANKAPQELAAYGDMWVTSAASMALRVPSAVCPVEFNCLLNPEHPDILSVVSKAEKIPFTFDARLK